MYVSWLSHFHHSRTHYHVYSVTESRRLLKSNPHFVLTICDFLGIGAGGWICAKVFAEEPVCVPGMSHTEDDSPAKVNKPSKYY